MCDDNLCYLGVMVDEGSSCEVTVLSRGVICRSKFEEIQEQVEFANFLKQLTLPRRVSSIGVMGDSVTYQETPWVEEKVKNIYLRFGKLNSQRLRCSARTPQPTIFWTD